jgi:uncharacterized membrane protein YeaQ/YmgE (transglycosylase-associated protein family)
MSTIIINLILQAIAGALGGNAAAAGLDKADLGRAANTIAGAIGGVAAGQIFSALLRRSWPLRVGSTLRPLQPS